MKYMDDEQEQFEIMSSAVDLEIGENIGPCISPTDSVSPPPKPMCEMCGIIPQYRQLHSHHVVPRWIGGDETDIIQVCAACHKKADQVFVNFLLDPWGGRGGKWGDKKKRQKINRDYRDKYVSKYRQIHRLDLDDGVTYRTTIAYNKKTGNVQLSYFYGYTSARRLNLTAIYNRANTRRKAIYYLSIEPNVDYTITLRHNSRTNHISILERYRFNPHHKGKKFKGMSGKYDVPKRGI